MKRKNTMYENNNINKRVVSGMRTTGSLHIGHYHGVLKNWLILQEKYECFFFTADLHAMTTHYNSSNIIKDKTIQMITEWLSVGINPNKSCIFVQSLLPEHSELHLILSMITPINWLNRIPSYKDKNNVKMRTYGFLGYPVLQTSDILLYNPDYVPIGEDQISHIEITRKISRKFNYIFGKQINIISEFEKTLKLINRKDLKLFMDSIKKYRKKNCLNSLEISKNIILNNISKTKKKISENFLQRKQILKEPKILLGKYPKLIGLDGRKMSKSYNNTINLIESQNSIEKKIKKMPTDPARIKINDPGNPEKCPIWQFHLLYNNVTERYLIQNGCKSASIGCIECKNLLIDKINKEHTPIRDKYNAIRLDKEYINSVIYNGSLKARKIARKTLTDIKSAIGLLL